MAKLTAKQESFIEMMTQGEELARRGFDLILKRADFDQFFDALKGADLFSPSHNPGPAAADKEGYFYIPYWSALDYLTAVARLSGEKNDPALANKVMEVVRSVSRWRNAEGLPRENYHTSRKFAEIFGLVPTASIMVDDIALIGVWLRDKFERGLVTQALDKGAIPRLLASPIPADWEKATEVLRQCTAIYPEPSDEDGREKIRRSTAGEDYWLTELLKHRAAAFGEKTGKKAADILVARVREVFSSESHRLSSGTYRPAIENHSQNYRWREDENWSVEGLRDVLLAWCESDPNSAKLFVESLLADEMEILRRIGIFVLGERWVELHSVYGRFLGPQLFNLGHLHELYNLLKKHFAELTEEEKAATIESIRQIPAPTWSNDPARSLKRIQRQWLSAIVGKGYEPADQWLAELQADPSLGQVSEHPDFGAYMESSVGPGPTPYSVQQLIAFAEAGVIVEKLNSFEEKDGWKGPTLEGLVSAVDEAVKVAPEPFLKLLPAFLGAKRAFQHCVIWGLKQAWEAEDGKQSEIDWNRAWERLVDFFEKLVGKAEFWEEKVPEGAAFVGTRDWIASAIAEFLDVGTRNDERAYSNDLLPRTWSLIQILLDKARAIEQPSDDAMFEAINSPKGKAVEALFSQALRICRAGDRAKGDHAEAWLPVKVLFEAELGKCKNANYEFSTLAAAYLPQLFYMDGEWTRANIGRIFPSESPSNSICAIDGLAYAQFTRPVYQSLAEQGVLDRALRYELRGRNSREKLLERIAAGYLWEEEGLDSSRFAYIFDTGRVDDLEVIARVFWTVRDTELSDAQRERVIQYWQRCVAWSQGLPKPPARLLSALSTLSCYVSTADGREKELLEAVAPYIYDGYNSDEFFAELLRLVNVSPDGVSAILGKAIESRAPSFDFEDRLKSLLRQLAGKGRKQDAILYAERLRALGMQELFDELTGSE
jgi:hypothetical protein